MALPLERLFHRSTVGRLGNYQLKDIKILAFHFVCNVCMAQLSMKILCLFWSSWVDSIWMFVLKGALAINSINIWLGLLYWGTDICLFIILKNTLTKNSKHAFCLHNLATPMSYVYAKHCWDVCLEAQTCGYFHMTLPSHIVSLHAASHPDKSAATARNSALR